MKKLIGFIAVVAVIAVGSVAGVNLILAQEVADKVVKVSTTTFAVEKAITGVITPEVKDEMEQTLYQSVEYDLDKKIQITTFDIENLKNQRLNNDNENEAYQSLIDGNNAENVIIDAKIAQGNPVLTE